MQWNAGGWFGGQIGATCWMLIAGILTAVKDLTTGSIVIGFFLLANLVGWLLWQTRRFSCYASTQLLIAISGAFGLLAVYVLERGGVWEEIQAGRPASTVSTYGVIALTFGGLLVFFYLRFGRDAGEVE